MPGQYVNHPYSRPIMSVVRTILSIFYLWMMMHASSIVIVAKERWDRGFLWDERLPDKIYYSDLLSKVPGGEFCVLVMIAAVLRGIHAACGCPLVGQQGPDQIGPRPRIEKIALCVPYMCVFLGCSAITIYVTVRTMMLWQPYDTSWKTYGKFTLALAFKIAILANMTWVCLRAYLKLMDLSLNGNRGRILNLGERLTQIFRN